jgi:hypothetical protein
MKLKIIIAGSRNFNNEELLFQKCGSIISNNLVTEIISGNSKGADQLGEKFAIVNGISVKKFIPNWQFYGRGAGEKRNIEMAKHANGLIAFWDGKSKGTKNMIEIAKKYNLRLWIFKTE